MASRKKQEKSRKKHDDVRKRQQKRNRRRYLKTNGDALHRACDWVVTEKIVSNLKPHGNTKWKFKDLIMLTVFWVWSAKDAVEAFKDAHKAATGINGDPEINSYQVMMNALTAWTHELLPILWCRVQLLLEELNGPDWMIDGWVVLAVDGTRVSMPRTKSNETHFNPPSEPGKKKKKKKKKSKGLKKNYQPQQGRPQAWLTLMWHVGYQIPWAWMVGPSNSSERDHFAQMLASQEFPENTLFCGDAGFVGYDLWKSMCGRNFRFLVRVGANVRLLTELGYHVRERDGIVYSWPDEVSKKGNSPPLTLRLIHLRDSSGEDVYLVTNVLNARLLSQETAARIYKKRWGIEVQFRHYKQTYEHAKLKCRCGENVETELHWSFFGLTLVQLLALRERLKANVLDEKTSVARVLRAVRKAITFWWLCAEPRETLADELRAATVDKYKRTSKKQSRNYPRHKDKPNAGKPIIIKAQHIHKKRLAKLGHATAA
jgi:hypothetical protein